MLAEYFCAVIFVINLEHENVHQGETMKKNKHIGSNFDDFLKKEDILEEVKVTALKRVISFLIQKKMYEKNNARYLF